MKLKNLFVCLFVAVMAISCQKSPKELLTKAWALDNIDYTELLKEVPAETREERKKEAAEQVDKMKGKIIFDFKADGKIVTTTPDYMSDNGGTKSEEGTWNISEDGKKVTVTTKERKEEYTVKTLTADEFSFEMQKMVMKFVPKK